MSKITLACGIIALIITVFVIGCSDDNILTDGSVADPPPDESHQIPTITIKKLRSEKFDWRCGVGQKIWWQLNATPTPKIDLAVMVNRGWVIIPKFKHSSEELNDTFSYDGQIQVQPLPTVSIVGKGVVIDLEKLQKGLPTYARGDHKIPVDYEFPPYKLGDPSQLLVEVGLKAPESRRPEAEFNFSNPSDGDKLGGDSRLTVFFNHRDTPGRVTINGKPATVRDNIATLRGPHEGNGPTPFNIVWDNGPCQTSGSHTITLNVIQPAPPRIIRKNFRSKDVDPAPLNRNGVIIEFSEPIAKHSLKLTLENGTHLGWLPKVDGMKITFEPLKGKELGNETTYIVQGAVFDAAGNRSNVKEIFVTRLKE